MFVNHQSRSLAYGSGAHAILKTVLRFADTPERANCGPLSPDRSNLASTALAQRHRAAHPATVVRLEGA